MYFLKKKNLPLYCFPSPLSFTLLSCIQQQSRQLSWCSVLDTNQMKRERRFNFCHETKFDICPCHGPPPPLPPHTLYETYQDSSEKNILRDQNCQMQVTTKLRLVWSLEIYVAIPLSLNKRSRSGNSLIVGKILPSLPQDFFRVDIPGFIYLFTFV